MNIKHKVTLLSVSLMIIGGGILLLGVNLAINYHIKKMAITSIEREIDFMYQDDSKIFEVDTNYIANDIQINSIFLSSDEGQQDNEYYTFAEKQLVSHFRKKTRKFPEKTFYLEIDENKYYLQIVFDQSNNRHIFYANISPIKGILSIVNISFALIVIILIVIAYVSGFQVGRNIEDFHQKLKNFFQNTSHELKTPLMSIQGYAEAINDGIIDDYHRAAQIIIKESERMTYIIDELLYLTKIDSGQVKMVLKREYLKQIILDSVALIDMTCRRKGITVDRHLGDEDIIVLCDELQLSKAIRNILSNAVRYAKKRIEISLVKERGLVYIKIIDDGPGVSDDDIEHIFERFYTGDSGNTGIGLSLAHEIIVKHHGQITVDNIEKGTCFSICLRQR